MNWISVGTLQICYWFSEWVRGKWCFFSRIRWYWLYWRTVRGWFSAVAALRSRGWWWCIVQPAFSYNFLESRYISDKGFVKINLLKFRFIEKLCHTAIVKNLNFCANSARSKTWSRKNISWTEMKSLLIEPSNVLPFYTSSQNSNLLYNEVDSLKRG